MKIHPIRVYLFKVVNSMQLATKSAGASCAPLSSASLYPRPAQRIGSARQAGLQPAVAFPQSPPAPVGALMFSTQERSMNTRAIFTNKGAAAHAQQANSMHMAGQ